MRIIDFHTHAFPDSLAEQTVAKLCAFANVETILDGKVCSLIAEMDRLSIEASVVLTIEEVYPGSRFDDTCVGEVAVWGKVTP